MTVMDDSLAILRNLIAAGRDGEPAVQAQVSQLLSAAGCAVDTLQYRPAEVPMRHEFALAAEQSTEQRAAVIGRLRGTGGGRSVILFAHPDSEPFRPDHGWRHDPFAGVVENGRLHGWGVADDLAGVAAMAGVAQRLAAGSPLAGDLILASTPSKRHARGVHAAMHHGFLADAAVYLHPPESGAGMREVKALASGQLVFQVVTTGQAPATNEPGHTAFAHIAVSAIDTMLPVLAALRALDARRATRPGHPALHAAIGRSTNLLVSAMLANERAGRVPTLCTITAALSFPPGESLGDVQVEVTDAIAGCAAAEPWLRQNPPALTFLSGVTGAEVATDHALWRVTADAVRAGTGAAPTVNPLHTSSDIRNPMVQQGIPCVGLGPLCGDLTQNGRTDEWVDVSDHRRCVDVLEALVRAWCGTSSAPV